LLYGRLVARILGQEDWMSAAVVQSNRVHLGIVRVDPVRIQESGLLMDDIVPDFPAETGDSGSTGSSRSSASTASCGF